MAPQPRPQRPVPNKRGVPLQTIWFNRELTAPQEVAACAALKLGWAYNYLPSWDTSAPGVSFWPMIFGATQATAPGLATAAAYNTLILGMNEPDQGPPQANMSPAAGAAVWPLFTATGKPLVSPVQANNLGTWLATFQADLGSTQWSYTPLHFYSSNFSQPDVVHAALSTAIQTVFAAWGKRVILSEFGLINFINPADPSTWAYPTPTQWQNQIAYSGPRLNQDDRVIGWNPYPLTVDAAARVLNPNSANLTLCDLSVVLTPAGSTYAAILDWP